MTKNDIWKLMIQEKKRFPIYLVIPFFICSFAGRLDFH